MENNKRDLMDHITIDLSKKDVITEADIIKSVEKFSVICPVTDEEKQQIIKEAQSKFFITMDVGAYIKEQKHKPWYFASKENKETKYWERYKTYLLRKGFARDVLVAMDSATDEMMDLLGDPNSSTGFSRRGLVIGDVQSGKTSTYIALMNKAADAGYRVIILLTGTIEKLRQQTQSRVDEGFVGLDSASLKEKNQTLIGVGKIDRFNAWAMTSTQQDFSAQSKNTNTGTLDSISVPVVFVLKKNKSIMKNLERWLKKYNARNGKIDLPMLLIDDEADNASVNTKKSEEEQPTAINECIRSLLNVFSRSNYVGYTATPYANIFINPDSDDEMLSDDLFPRHFIYALNAPSNYIGATGIFDINGKYNYMLKSNDDCAIYLPAKHKKSFKMEKLPRSLKEAIASFFIVNTIRDLRGHNNTHRSMLINVSIFIDVQNSVKLLVEDFVKEQQISIKNYGKMGEFALKKDSISFIKEVYENHFAGLSEKELQGEEMFSWETIQENMSSSISSIIVRTVNAGNAQKNLNYDDYDETGLRIITIGGFSLSRGLTLEGLSTSYFYRNSKMYDTLMQMGRWFGYRNHYADLCQIWMSEESTEWYEHIAEASEELKREVKKMSNSNRTPEDFGLGVRRDINSLIVTAVNKMYSTKEVSIAINLSGTMIETTHIPLDNQENYKNFECVSNWLDNLIDNNYSFATSKLIGESYEELEQNHLQILNVSKENIISLINDFEFNPYNMTFRDDEIIGIINNAKDDCLDFWDVIIADNKNAESIEIGKHVNIGPITRSFGVNKEKKYIQMSGSKSRLGSVNYAKGGLAVSEVMKIQNLAKQTRNPNDIDKSFSQDEYFNTGYRRNPLLVIYPTKLSLGRNEADEKQIEEKQEIINSFDKVWMGLAIGIPSIDGMEKLRHTYVLNLIKYKEYLGIDDDYYEETGVE